MKKNIFLLLLPLILMGCGESETQKNNRMIDQEIARLDVLIRKEEEERAKQPRVQSEYEKRMVGSQRKPAFINYKKTLALLEEKFSSTYPVEVSDYTEEDSREKLRSSQEPPSLLVSSEMDIDIRKAMRGDAQAQYNIGLILSRKGNYAQQIMQGYD